MHPNDALALDKAIFQALEENKGSECLRFWECSSPAVIVGASGAIENQVQEDACIADGVSILRRKSGGGAVVLGPGCLNYSLILSLEARPELRDITASYRVILGKIIRALDVTGLALQGTSDIALLDRKVSGNAQRRGRRTLLHHGTMLYDFDVSWMERYLKEPERRPEYRGERGHRDFVTNLPIEPNRIKERITRAFEW